MSRQILLRSCGLGWFLGDLVRPLAERHGEGTPSGRRARRSTLTVSPGFCVSTATERSAGLRTGLPAKRRRSPLRMPALGGRAAGDDGADQRAVGLRGVARGDAEVGALDLAALDELRHDALDAVDRHGEADAGVAAAARTAICELTPITRPSASSSGPPELPGLIAASVCTAPEIEKPLGAWILRSSAEMMPLVTVP